jgi:isopenicillin-N epimerase
MSPIRNHWTLDPEVVFLNHGSFGACPRPVLYAQAELRARMEREPVRFFVHELEGLLDAARAEVAGFLGARDQDLAFVSNATTAVNAVLASLPLAAGDELVCTNYGYNACWTALHRWGERAGARVVQARVPWPIGGPDEVVAAVLAAVTPRTRLVLVDHVTSPTGLLFPVEALARALAARGVDLLVDGAHAPGMLPLALDALGQAGVAWYTGNFHKWCCAPKGAAFLWARRDRQAGLHPVVTSHGANARRADRSRFHLEFDWVGTADPTPALCVPAALRFMAGLLPGGWDAVRRANHDKALAARRVLAAALGVALPAPDDMLGALAALPLPDGDGAPPTSSLYADPLQETLYERFRIQVPIVPWPGPPRRLVRVSAQLYNDPTEYEVLAAALREVVGP